MGTASPTRWRSDFGTDPYNADSDDDGLSDGTEVDSSMTDPLRADTDGGGENDGDEVSNGRDPLDPADDMPSDADADADADTDADADADSDTDTDADADADTDADTSSQTDDQAGSDDADDKDGRGCHTVGRAATVTSPLARRRYGPAIRL